MIIIIIISLLCNYILHITNKVAMSIKMTSAKQLIKAVALDSIPSRSCIL